MSTHFRPRASASAPQSPVRPGSARPTIRAITPSPPHHSSGATNESRAQSEKLHAASPEVIKQLSMRLQGEEIQRARSHGFKNEEIVTMHKISRNHVEQQGGGSIMARKSPLKRQGRSKSQRDRLNTSPTAQSSHCRILVEDQMDQEEEGSASIKPYEAKKMQRYHNKDISIDCPDTPTPMTLSQKRSAYLPLGTSTPAVFLKRSSSATSSPNDSNIEITMSLTEYTVQRTNPLAQHPQVHSDMNLANNTDETVKPNASQPLPEAYRPFDSTPQTTVQQADVIRPDVHQDRYRTTLPSSAVPHNPILATSTPAQQLPSPSRVSNNSGGTVESQHSVFSTPGRDEFERKRAMVEVDEGPFGKAVTVAELNKARRVVSKQDGSADDDGKKRGKTDKMCGMSRGCIIM